jgi:Tfp pilus assembly protein PilP
MVPQETQAAATVERALPLDETTLIGLFSGPEGGSALLRLPGGQVVKVATGGYAAGGRVTAIGEDSLRLQRGGRELVLTLPG